jgi:hypothetical protein
MDLVVFELTDKSPLPALRGRHVNWRNVMSEKNRRVFLMQVVAGSTALIASRAMAQAPARLPETDPQAAALGYKEDTTKVDAKKYPKHDKAQKCSNCQLYTGKASEAYGPCSIFPGKVVAANGWCTAWVKKAA